MKNIVLDPKLVDVSVTTMLDSFAIWETVLYFVIYDLCQSWWRYETVLAPNSNLQLQIKIFKPSIFNKGPFIIYSWGWCTEDKQESLQIIFLPNHSIAKFFSPNPCFKFLKNTKILSKWHNLTLGNENIPIYQLLNYILWYILWWMVCLSYM